MGSLYQYKIWGIPLYFVIVGFGFIVLAILVFPPTLKAAPCEFPDNLLFPNIKFYKDNETIYLYPEMPDYSSMDNYSITRDSEVAYKFIKKSGLTVIDKKEILKSKEITSNYLKVDDSFEVGDVKYTLLKFGIRKEQKKKVEVFKIKGISRHKVEKMLEYKPWEYLGQAEGSEIIVSEINIAVVLGSKLFAGFGGGFAEGTGMPGGVAVFDLIKNQWHVEWRKELIDLYVTDIIPISQNTLWFSTRDDQEFFPYPPGYLNITLRRIL